MLELVKNIVGKNCNKCPLKYSCTVHSLQDAGGEMNTLYHYYNDKECFRKVAKNAAGAARYAALSVKCGKCSVLYDIDEELFSRTLTYMYTCHKQLTAWNRNNYMYTRSPKSSTSQLYTPTLHTFKTVFFHKLANFKSLQYLSCSTLL